MDVRAGFRLQHDNALKPWQRGVKEVSIRTKIAMTW